MEWYPFVVDDETFYWTAYPSKIRTGDGPEVDMEYLNVCRAPNVPGVGRTITSSRSWVTSSQVRKPSIASSGTASPHAFALNSPAECPYHVRGKHHVTDARSAQRDQLDKTIEQARKIHRHLRPLLHERGHEVHFRPGSSSIAMVGLRHDRPQRGLSGIRDVDAFAASFETHFQRHCVDAGQRKATGEKALQSFLIRDAFAHGGRLHALNVASGDTAEPVELVFVTDEIALPLAPGKIVCDVLALRRDHGRSTPVLLELKDARLLTKLADQVTRYAALVDDHADRFALLFGALLDEEITFDGPTETWIVWPLEGVDRDPREAKLAEKGIRVVGYSEPRPSVYGFRVGEAPPRR